MHPIKALGPDRMPALFFKKFWHIIGHDVLTTVLDVLNNNVDLSQLNHTHICLIQKIKKPKTQPKDYRPISLCNIIIKIVTKTIAYGLKMVLLDIIHFS